MSTALQRVHEVERQLGIISTDGNKLSWQCNVNGYSPEEIKVEISGRDVKVCGEHRGSTDGEAVFRSFESRMTLPNNANVKEVECQLDIFGHLIVTVPVRQPTEHSDDDNSMQKSVPIGYKKEKFQAVQWQKLTVRHRKVQAMR